MAHCTKSSVMPVAVTVTPAKAGTKPFHCSAMGMGNGKLVVAD